MRNGMLGTMLAFALLGSTWALAQDRTLASTIDVYVFPSGGQDTSQQSRDEADCYQWAVANTGSDPFDLAKQQEAGERQAEADLEAAQQVGRGAAAGGAVGGAAAGALIGEIANDDAGHGAAWGAGLGAIASRRRAREARAEATVATAAQAESSETELAEQAENFKKAFSVCLEANDYMVKY